jgi:hypothetical protein
LVDAQKFADGEAERVFVFLKELGCIDFAGCRLQSFRNTTECDDGATLGTALGCTGAGYVDVM